MGRLVGLTAAMVLVVVMVPTAYGQAPTQDSVVGSALVGASLGAPEAIIIDAHSGPSGENPTGTVATTKCLGLPGGFCGPSGSTGGVVTCLNVQGNRAVVGWYGARTHISGSFLFTTLGLAEIIDNGVGPGKDHLTYAWTYVVSGFGDDVPYTRCPSTLQAGSFSGQIPASPAFDPQDFVVTDAHPLPTSKGQCKNGGWQTYGSFKNQGDCVSFVATGGKSPPAG